MASKAAQLEQERGKPLKDVLREDFPQFGTLSALARFYGVNQSTLSYWLLKTNLTIKTELVEMERAS